MLKANRSVTGGAPGGRAIEKSRQIIAITALISSIAR